MKTGAMAVAAAALVAAVSLVPDQAHAQRRGGAVAAGVIGGLAAGALIGGAVAGPRYYGGGYYGGGPYYATGGYYDEPPCEIRRQRFWDGYGWRVQRVRVCY